MRQIGPESESPSNKRLTPGQNPYSDSDSTPLHANVVQNLLSPYILLLTVYALLALPKQSSEPGFWHWKILQWLVCSTWMLFVVCLAGQYRNQVCIHENGDKHFITISCIQTSFFVLYLCICRPVASPIFGVGRVYQIVDSVQARIQTFTKVVRLLYAVRCKLPQQGSGQSPDIPKVLHYTRHPGWAPLTPWRCYFYCQF